MYHAARNSYAITMGVGVCGKFYENTTSASKPSSSINEEIPLILTKGDRVHATRFSKLITSRSSWDGTLSARAFQPAPQVQCGPTGGDYINVDFDAGYAFSEGIIPSTPMDASLMEKMRGIAETKALADVRRSYNNMPLLLVERRETFKMIVKRVRLLTRQGLSAQRDALAKYFGSHPNARRQVAKDLANLHLEMLFGWLPVMAEIEGLCDQLAAEKSQILTGRGRMANDVVTRESFVTSDDYHLRVDHWNCPAGFAVVSDLRRRHSARTSLRYEINIAAAQALRDNGFNPVATFYDLVPLSFLSDFVSNLGTFLRSYDPLIGCRYITGSTSTWYEEERISKMIPRSFVNPWGYQVTMSGDGQQSARSLLVDRFPLVKPPEASLWFVNNLTLGKAATAAALAVQRYLKPLRRAVGVRPFRYKGPRPKYLPPINYRP